MTDTLVADTPTTVMARKRVNRRNAQTLLKTWQAGGLNFEEEVTITLYKNSLGRLKLEQGGAEVRLTVPAGYAASWKAEYHEQKRCTLLNALLSGSETTVCLEYYPNGNFSHGTMTVVGSATSGYVGARSTSYASPAGRMV